MKDPLAEIADERMVQMALDVVVQLERGTENRPVLWLVARARARAREALAAFVEVDPTDAAAIREIQNKLRIYDDYINDLRELLTRGREIDRELFEQDRTEIEALVGANPNRGID